jgi:hypothetical protein
MQLLLLVQRLSIFFSMGSSMAYIGDVVHEPFQVKNRQYSKIYKKMKMTSDVNLHLTKVFFNMLNKRMHC